MDNSVVPTVFPWQRRFWKKERVLPMGKCFVVYCGLLIPFRAVFYQTTGMYVVDVVLRILGTIVIAIVSVVLSAVPWSPAFQFEKYRGKSRPLLWLRLLYGPPCWKHQGHRMREQDGWCAEHYREYAEGMEQKKQQELHDEREARIEEIKEAVRRVMQERAQ